jgi:hypothetical protein
MDTKTVYKRKFDPSAKKK